MPLVVKDRIKETTTTTGTGTVTLAGTSTGFQSFSAVGNGNTTYYAIVDNATGAWETGLGTYTSSGTTLSRDTVLASSNAGALVNFAAGSKDVFCTYPADRAVLLDSATNATIPGITLSGGTANGVAYLNGSNVVTTGSALQFDGTNFGVGTTSPSTYTVAPNLVVATSGSGGITVRTGNANYGGLYFADGVTGNEQYRGFVEYRHNQSGIVDGLLFGTAGATKMTLDSSGNLGVSVTPSPNSIAKTVELQAGVNLFGFSNTAYLNANSYFDGGGWLYKATAAAARYQMGGGSHTWHYAPSGTAGTAVTFTQGMVLNSTGNFGVGGDPGTSLRTLFYAAGINNILQLESGSNTGVRHTFKQPNKEYRIGIETNGSLTKTFGIYDVTNNLTDFMASDTGNIGLGLEPSTWGNSGNVQINNNLGFRSTSPNIVSNAYNNTGWYYYATGAAAQYQQSSGQHIWGSAASGTANTFFTFTQTMLLDTNGDLKINSGYGSVATTYGCRAWVNFNGTSTVTIRASGNVTSITDNGTGDYTVNFTNAMPDANYAPTGISKYASDNASGAGTSLDLRRTATNLTTGSFRVGTFVPNTGVAIDSEVVSVAVFR